MKASAEAHSNIALVKYWGKRDLALNLPAGGSLSVTLGGLTTKTSVEFGDFREDSLILDGDKAQGRALQRVSSFLGIIREQAGFTAKARVESSNNFPTAAGLASSASGFAALALAGTHAADLDLSRKELSILARRGSGSAARSIYGGFVRMAAGEREDGTDSHAHRVAPADHWDLRCFVAQTQFGAKKVASTDGMQLTQDTSPLYQAWLDTVDHDIGAAMGAIETHDFRRLALIAEGSCMAMHASALAARPAVIYWNAATMSLIHQVRLMREDGLGVFFTIDAGPHVKVFCEGKDAPAVKQRLEDVPEVLGLIETPIGGDARLVDA